MFLFPKQVGDFLGNGGDGEIEHLVAPFDFEIQRLPGGVVDDFLKIFPEPDFPALDGDDFIPGLQAGHLGGGVRLHLAGDQAQGLHAHQVHHPVDRHREQEVEQGTGEGDGQPVGDRGPGKGPFFQFRGLLVILALHLHVPA